MLYRRRSYSHNSSYQRSSSVEKTSSAGWYGQTSRSRRFGPPKTTADVGAGQGSRVLGTPPRRVALQDLVQSPLAARDRRVNVPIDHTIEGREDPLFQILVSVRTERK